MVVTMVMRATMPVMRAMGVHFGMAMIVRAQRTG